MFKSDSHVPISQVKYALTILLFMNDFHSETIANSKNQTSKNVICLFMNNIVIHIIM